MDVRLQLDHIVILVNDLAIAAKNYTNLGFTVIPGGEHKALGSSNALVCLEDGAYLELIAFRYRSAGRGHHVLKEDRAHDLRKEKRSPMECRVLPWESAGEGLVDYAALPSEIDSVLESARNRGLKMVGPVAGGRIRPDGQYVSWQLGLPDGYDLPFLCADVTSRSLRVPEGVARQHANGIIGVAAIRIGVRDVAKSVARLRALLGCEPLTAIEYPSEDADSVEFRLGETTLILAQPRRSSGTLMDQLDYRGEGPCGLWLRSAKGNGAQRMDLACTHGVPIIVTGS